MNKPKNLPLVEIDQDDVNCNSSSNATFENVLQARISRRTVLRGGVASAVGAIFGSLGLSACGGGNANGTTPVTAPNTSTEILLGFDAIGYSLADSVIVPTGYAASVIYALGDPLTASTPAFKNDGTDTNFENRSGDHHDGMEYFGLSATGMRDPNSSDRALLAVNHENITQRFLHAGTPSAAPRDAAEVDKEIAAHGVAVVEVRKGSDGRFATVQDSTFNRRITPNTPVQLSGEARGHSKMQTVYSSTGTAARGTINNCGTGMSPWGTLLTGEENWAGYFTLADVTGLSADEVTSLARYGRASGNSGRYRWDTATPTADEYVRWDITASGAGPTADYRNEINTFGYMVEIDPYDKTATIKKRTSLGRMAHESATFGLLTSGMPVVAYMGDDSRGEYIYKYVSNDPWDPVHANAIDRIAVGDKYLDNGSLYVAKFNDDGTGNWIELNISNADIANYATYNFVDQADVLINARLAADAVGATKMDRPEWCSVHPTTGEVYYTLTNNSQRRIGSATMPPNPANPRDYQDDKNGSPQNGNVNGHIIRLAEGGGKGAAITFNWDVYLFGAEHDAPVSNINLSNLTSDQDFSSPDGAWFSPSTGLFWIQTDDGAYTDVTNCMMLAAIPGQVGDGGTMTITNTNGGTQTVTTHVGKPATADTLKRFLVGPTDCEITGIAETPDGKTLFVNVQHPGSGSSGVDIADPSTYRSHWPDGGMSRPRSATIVITKDDGGRIGS
jgi:secreted PhoX family phosphatase